MNILYLHQCRLSSIAKDELMNPQIGSLRMISTIQPFRVTSPNRYYSSSSSFEPDQPVHPIHWITNAKFIDNLEAHSLFRTSPTEFSEEIHRLHTSTSLSPTGVNVGIEPVGSGNRITQHGWLQQNIQNSGLRSVLNSRSSDGLLNWADMIVVFKQAEDRGKVDKLEFEDLKDLVSSNSIAMSSSVRVLSRKIVNGDFADRSYRGNSLGNLTDGSSATHLEQLVDKWFLGVDRPVAQPYWSNTTYRYQLVSKPLFQNGISYQDIKQEGTGDYYFLAGLAATALHDPSKIRGMFTDNGDGSYTVRFYKRNDKADYVTVDSFLPVYPWGQSICADYSNELWVALAEKAYAQLNASGWIGHSRDDWDFRPADKDTNSYKGISCGLPDEATEQITGQSMMWKLVKEASSRTIVEAFKAGDLVSFGSEYSTSPKIVASHAYILVDYNSVTKKFTLYNPWGIDGSWDKQDTNSSDGKLELFLHEIKENFYSWYMNWSSSSKHIA